MAQGRRPDDGDPGRFCRPDDPLPREVLVPRHPEPGVLETNQWGYFQSKSIKQHTYEIQKQKLELERLALPDMPKAAARKYEEVIANYDKNIQRYEKEKNEIKGQRRIACQDQSRCAVARRVVRLRSDLPADRHHAGVRRGPVQAEVPLVHRTRRDERLGLLFPGRDLSVLLARPPH